MNLYIVYDIIKQLGVGGKSMEPISKEHAIQLLNEDACKIKQLIQSQKNSLCIFQCKAFEEIIDTQIYGFSRQVTYAERLGLLTIAEGQQLIKHLGKELDQLYADIYEKE